MSHDPDKLKDTVEIAKNCFEIVGFLLVGLYFLYRLLAGFFIPCRLSVELTCDTPFTDKNVVKSSVKLKNTGPASVRITDARLWAFRLEPNRSEPDRANPNWPAPPALRAFAAEVRRDRLDFQRLSGVLDTGEIILHQAEQEHGWLNLETQGEQQRQFVFRLERGYYKIEFRLMGTPMFGRDTQIFRNIAYKLFPLSRYSQWAATSVVEVNPRADWWKDWT